MDYKIELGADDKNKAIITLQSQGNMPILNPKLQYLLLVWLLFMSGGLSLKPTAPIIATPNTQSSPSNFILSFSLSYSLPTSSYLLLTFPFFPSTITPSSCTLLNSLSISTQTCQNLNIASSSPTNPLTINSTVVNQLNPNVQTTLTIVVSFSQVMVAGVEIKVQIILQDNLPAVGALAQSVQMYVMSGTGVMVQQNWNMGQVYLQETNTNLLNVVSINSQTGNLPGITISNLLLDITIGVSSPTPLSVLVLTISGQFQFTVSSLVTQIAVSGDPPQILSTTVISRNVIKVLFNQQFIVGRQFRLVVSNIYNPLQISSGSVSVYYMPYNSISPLEVHQNSVPFQTISHQPVVSIYNAEGIAPVAPLQFYMDTQQYITVAISLPRSFDPTFIVQIRSDVLAFQEGSVYLKTSTINSNSLIYSLVDPQTIQISGFTTAVPSGSIITVTMRAWIGTSPIFNIYASIGTAAHVAASAPIIYGTASATVAVVPQPFISGLTGNAGQANTLTAMKTTTSSISFSVTPLFQTFSGSFLQLYTSKYLIKDATFNPSTSCLVNSVAQPCTISTTSQYTLIKIASSSSFNLYPMSTTTPIQINQLKFTQVSSHSTYLYHFYFQLTVSLATGATVKKYLGVPQVVPQRSQLNGFNLYFSNDIYNSGQHFVNVIRLVSQDSTSWQNVIQANQKRVITIFAYQGWKQLFTSLKPYQTYPCASNVAASYTYLQGAHSQNHTTTFPLNWDRIHIVLPGTESSTKFSIIIPTLYNINAAHLFEVMVGFQDTNNGEITYLEALAKPTSGAPTYLMPANILVYSKPKQNTTMLNIAGLAGAYQNGVSMTVAPSGSFSGTTYNTALILISTWQFYDSLTALSSSSLASADPLFSNTEQTPLCLKLSQSSYLTYIPFKTVGAYSALFSILLDNIKFPYSLDLPYYSMMLIDQTGALDVYNQFINQDQNIFYTGVLKELTMTCHDNSLGVTNTYCTVGFRTFQEIEVGSVVVATLHGMLVSTDLCTMIYSSNSTKIPISSCTPNINLNVLTITLGNNIRLPADTAYSLTLNGISIDSTTLNNYLTLQIMDPTNAYAIQQKTIILITSVQQSFPIEITQVHFSSNNPVVIGSLFLNFTLPRPLNNDQAFAMVLSKDFITLNNVPSKIKIRLLMADGVTVIPVSWIMKSINSQIIFQGLQGTLTANSYSLQLYGVQTPSTVDQTMISLIYLRIYDNTYATTNTVSSTALFPSLTSKVDSLITLQTYFNTQGQQQELLFTVVNQFVPITQETVWYITLPIYYSQLIWNQDYLMYCTISGTPLTCALSQYTPYQIVLTDSPLLIPVGSSQTYTINIYGITCPRAAYLNGNTMFATENIFIAMKQSTASTSFSDYSSLYLSNPIIDPQTQAGYGSIILKEVTSSNMQVYQSTFFTITVTCSIDIPVNSWIFITFPKQFDNFNNIGVVVQTQTTSTIYQVSTSSIVVNRRIGYQLNTIAITADTQFQIMLTSLLTPTQPVEIDMNSLHVMVASSDKLSTIATSIASRNQLGSLTFLPNSLHLVVNNYSPIQLTAGTYSTPIKINPSDNSTFLTNMQVTFSSPSLTFLTNPTYLYLGNAHSTFILGTGQNTIPTTYSFNLVKKQTSVSAFYSVLSQYAVQINSIPVVITFPSSFTVPQGGCSMPVAVSLTNPPYSYIEIYYQYNTTAIAPNLFWVNQEISYEQMQFDINNTQRWVSFCSHSSMNISSFSIQLNIGGDNAASFSFSNPTSTINIVNDPSINTTPTLTLTASNVQKTFSTIQATTNVAGYLYYQLSISPLTQPLSLTDIHTYVKSNSLTLESNDDYLTTMIYSKDRDHRVGYKSMLNPGVNFVNIDNMLPERAYTFCAYFQNQFFKNTNIQCINFTMQSWGLVSKAQLTFSTPILANQLNNLLCFFVKASESEITQIVSLEGASCSLNTSPQNYFYTYQGNLTSNQYTSLIIYHFPDKNLTTDPSISAFSALFDANGLTAANLALAQTQFSVNFISSSRFISTFEPLTVINSASYLFQPSVSFTLNLYQSKSYKASISNLVTNVPATIYFILVSYKNITRNQITSSTTITIKPLSEPSSEQIASCVDGSGYTAVQCRRVAMGAGSTFSFSFGDLIENSVYAVYYTWANQYPQRPVFYGSVKKQYIFTTTHEPWIITAILTMALLLTALIF